VHPHGPCHLRPAPARRRLAAVRPGWLGAALLLGSASARAQGGFDALAAVPAGLGLPLLLGAVLTGLALWRLLVLWRARGAAQAAAYAGIEHGPWPELTVFIAPCRDPQTVSGCIQALLNADYPAERLRIVPVSDHPHAPTRAVIDAYAHLFPERIQPHHRDAEAGAGPATLQAALALARGDIAVVVDAAYLPSAGLLRQLALPFFDPEVGAVMGRVVQLQAARGLLSRVLGRLLRDQPLAGQPQPREASLHLRAVPDGSTVGGVRLSAVVAVGGWSEGAFDRHTDITVRLLRNGWKTVYNHRAECLRARPPARVSGTSPAARSPGGDAGLITAEGPRQVRLTAERRARPLRLRPMPTLQTARARRWRAVFLRPPLPVAAAAALALLLLGTAPLLAAAVPLTTLLVLSAWAAWPRAVRP
jgi:hypothetical protein